MEAARAALHKFHANMETAVEELLKCAGDIPQSWIDAAFASSSFSGSSSSDSSGSSSGSGSSGKESFTLRNITKVN